MLVNGDGLRVNYVQGGTKVGGGTSVVGHMEIWGHGFHINTPDRTYRNSGKGPRIEWDNRAVYLYRDLPEGSQVCSRFWRKYGSGYWDRGIACKRIER